MQQESTTPEREPKIDPMCGDILRRDDRVRTVTGLSAKGRVLVGYAYDRKGKQCRTACTLAAWRKWAAKAAILKQGSR